MNITTADTVYNRLIAETQSPRRKQSLVRVKEACDFLEKNRVKITPAAVGQYCEDRHTGPKEQSLRNSPDLMQYLKVRAASQRLPIEVVQGEPEILVSDPNVTAYIQLLKAQRDEAIREKNGLVKAIRKMRSVNLDELIAEKVGLGTDGEVGESVRPEPRPEVCRAILKLLGKSPEISLREFSLEVDRRRLRLAGGTRPVLLNREEMEALAELVGEVLE